MSLMLSGPLVSVADVVDALEDPALRLIDCRWYLGRRATRHPNPLS